MARARDATTIYDRIDFSRVKFKQVLAGYIDPNSFKRIRKKKGDRPNASRYRYRLPGVESGILAWRTRHP
jgi:hypothetical protein